MKPADIELMSAESVRQAVEKNMGDPHVVDGIRTLLKMKALGILPEAVEHLRQSEAELYSRKAQEMDKETRKRVMWELIRIKIFANLGDTWSEKTDKDETMQPWRQKDPIRISEGLYDLMQSCLHIGNLEHGGIFSMRDFVEAAKIPENARRRTYMLTCPERGIKLWFTVDIDNRTGEVSWTKLEESSL